MAAGSQSQLLQAAVQRGLISSDVAEEVSRRAGENNRTVGDQLVQEGFLTQHLVNTIASQLDQKDEPTSIAKFRILSKLGQGGMGTVYRAMQLSMQRQVALKVIAPQYAVDKAFCERFIREARTAGQINHQNVITCYDVGQDRGYLYMALELVTGGDAAQAAVREGGRMNQSRAFEVIADCANGLAALKRCGLVHRDIKPANIFITDDGIAKLADLGLARSSSGSSDRMTVTGSPMGTPAFMSPEQASGAVDVDIRTDIYSLGASLFALLTGEAPYKGTSAWDVVAQVLKDPVPDPRNVYRGISDGAASIIMKAMAKDRKERYGSPEDLIDDLDLVAAGKSPRHARLLPPIQDTWSSIAEPRKETQRQGAPTANGFERSAAAVAVGSATESIEAVVDRRMTWPWTFAALVAVGIWIAVAPKVLPAPDRARSDSASAVQPPTKKVESPAPTTHPDGSVEFPLNELSRKPQKVSVPPEQPKSQIAPQPIPLPPQNPAPKIAPEPPPAVPKAEENPPSQTAKPDSELSKILVSVLPVDPEDEAEAKAAPKPIVAPKAMTEVAPEKTPPVATEDKPKVVEAEKPEVDPESTKPVLPANEPPAQPAVAGPQIALAKQWQNFLTVKKFDCVVQPLPSGKVAIAKVNPSARDFSVLQSIPLESLDLDGCSKLDGDLSFLNARSLKTLKLRGCKNLKSLHGIENAPITELTLAGCQDLGGDLMALRGMKLTRLDLSGCASLKSLDGLQAMPLTELDLSGCESLAPDLSALKGMKLTKLNLSGCEKLVTLEGIAGMPLTRLDCSGCRDLIDVIPVAGLKLTALSLKDCKKLKTLRGLRGLPLIELQLEGCETLAEDLSELKDMKLTKLTLAGCRNLKSLEGVQGMQLTELNLSHCASVPDLLPVRGMPLTFLDCSYCSSLTSLDGVQGSPLKRVVINRAGKLQNQTALLPLAGIKGVQVDH